MSIPQPKINITSIPAPRVPFIDSRTGLMAREWYRFFLNLYQLTGSGSNEVSLTDLQVGPPVTDQSGNFEAVYDQAQLASMMTQVNQDVENISSFAQLQPSAPQLGTLSAINQDNVPFLGFQTAPTFVNEALLPAGTVWWDTTGTLNIRMGNGNITQQVGEGFFRYGKASAAINDTNLQLVYKTGVVGAFGVITFAPAVAGITDPDQIIGIATESIANNGFGRVTTIGVVRGINTTGSAYGETWADNDDIWYNPVTGGLTKVKPSAPNLKLQVGTVIKAGSGGSGSFSVNKGSSSALGGTDSNVQLGTLVNKDLLQYDSALGYWKNVAAASVSVGTATNLAGGLANQIPYQSAPGTTAFSAGLTFDGTNFATTGTASAKSFIPTASIIPTNGLYLPAANAVGIATNSINAFYIDSGQNVGFGAAPGERFDIQSTLGVMTARVKNNATGAVAFGGSYTQWVFSSESASATLVQVGGAGYLYGGAGSFNIINNSNAPVAIFANNTEWLRVVPTGGISFGSSGTAYGTSGQLLQSTGNTSPTWTSSPSLTSLAINGNFITPFAGFKNKLLNGDCSLDQRTEGAAKTFTAGAAISYCLDAWYGSCTGANVTGQRVAGTGANQYAYKFTGATSNTATLFGQRIEAARVYDMVSSTVVGSLTVSSSSIATLTWTAYYANSTNTFSSNTQIATGTITINSTATRYSFSFNAGANAKNGVAIEFTTGALTAGNTVQYEALMFEKGTSVSAFEYLPTTVNTELCRRFYEKSYEIGKAPGANLGNLDAFTGQNMLICRPGGGTGGRGNGRAPFVVEKFANPSLSYWDGAGNASAVTLFNTNSQFVSNNNTADGFRGIYGSTTSVGFQYDTGSAACCGIMWVAKYEL